MRFYVVRLTLMLASGGKREFNRRTVSAHRTASKLKPTGPWWGFTAAWVGASYFAVAQLSLLLLKDGVAVFWPAAGIASGVLIVLGPPARAPMVLGVVIASVAAKPSGRSQHRQFGCFFDSECRRGSSRRGTRFQVLPCSISSRSAEPRYITIRCHLCRDDPV